MAESAQSSSTFKVCVRQEGLEYKLALAFGFMSVIPILTIWAWARANQIDLGWTLYAIAVSVIIGYFVIARPIISMVLRVTEKARALSAGDLTMPIAEVDEHNEIGELARSFNRITKELEHKIDELESSRELVKKLLARIGTAMNSYEGIDNLLNLIIENSAAALEAQMGTLMLVDGEKQELYIKTTWSNNGQTADVNLRMKVGEGIPGSVVKEHHPMRSTGTASSLGFLNTHHPDAAIMSVPLQLRDHPIGVLTIMREDPHRVFTEDDEMLLGSIGSQVAVAIENYRLNLDVERTYLETIMALALAVEAKDPYSAGHSRRVGYYAMKIGESMGLDQEMLRTLNDAGILHDIGKIGIKDEILLKPGPLSQDERRIMQQHSVIGEAIVKPIRSLSKVVALVRCHHERYDGGGYPGGLKGDEIPLGARIISVADTYDAMMTDRPYRKRLTLDQTKAELKKCAGSQHDPKVVEVFLKMIEAKELRMAAAKETPNLPPPVQPPVCEPGA